jgi:hypothetical protein
MTTEKQPETLRRQPTCRSSRPAPQARRRGFSSVAAILIIIIGIATLMLVVNWTYLNLASRRTQSLAETLAWSAVSQLLDDEKLQDVVTFDQSDDMTDTENAIITPGTGLLDENNAASGPTLRVELTDLSLTFGRVENTSSPAVGANFGTPLDPTLDPYNTLLVEILRDPAGVNPVELLIRGLGSPDAAKISGASCATLDSRVIGFQPGSVFAPVAPLAVEAGVWFNDRPFGGLDSNTNLRPELDVLLEPVGMGETASGALVNLMEGAAYDSSILAGQIENGVFDADVSGGLLGPATAGDPMPLFASQATPASPDSFDIADAFNAVANSSYPKRVFPIYSGAFAGTSVDIIGFIGARVLEAAVEDAGSGDRLRVRIEPEFIVHSTVVTDTTATVPENIYIHKIRLTR